MVEVALTTKFKLGKGAHTADIIRTVHSGFLSAQLNSFVRFTMEESQVRQTSAVERVLRRFPEMKQFDHMIFRPWGLKGQAVESRRIGNDLDSPIAGTPVDLSTILEIAAGIPKRYPFFSSVIRVTDPAFGHEPLADTARVFWPGLMVEDSWGASKRKIALSALAVVEADPASEMPPSPADSVAAVLSACGQHSRFRQIVLPGQKLEASDKAAVIEREVNARVEEIIKQARLPHEISEERDQSPWQPAGPRKPALVGAFRPLGYACQGQDMSTLVCSRRTASNLIVRLRLEFGTWSMHVEPTYSLHGFGFAIAVRLPVYPLPVAKTARPSLDDVRWRQVVENLAALVAELDRSVAPSIEEAIGPTPAWYEPEFALWATPALMHPIRVRKPAHCL